MDAGISPNDNQIGIYDTSLGCITHTYFDDTVTTGLYISSPVYQSAGAMSDPFFGTLTSATYFQLLPLDLSYSIYDATTIDSAVLVVPYSGFKYGDSVDNTVVPYQAFLLNDNLAPGTSYKSYETKNIDLVSPLSEPTPVNLYRLGDSTVVGSSKYQPGLRIRLNLQTLLNRLKPAHKAASDGGDQNIFRDQFKGVCLKVADARNMAKSLPYFKLDGSGGDYSGAGILVYYHKDTAPNDVKVERYFFAGENCGFFNNVNRDWSHSPVSKLINSTAGNDSVIAIQNLPGPCLDVMITGIKSLPSGVINKAELQLAMLPWYEDSRFAAVNRLFPFAIANGTYPAGVTAGTKRAALDVFSGSNPFGNMISGELQTLRRNGTDVKAYTVNIPREVMASWKAGNDTLHLRLEGTQLFVGAYRAVLGGGNHTNVNYRAKLFVVYSSLNK